MDTGCIILSCLLFLQMIMILAMLNPIYDVRRVTDSINNLMKNHKRLYYMVVISYFVCVVHFGMYVPLQNIHNLVFSTELNDYNKLVLFSRVEKNYVIAGFSLFLVVVQYAVRALIAYTASLMDFFKRSEPLVLRSESKENKSHLTHNEYIMANLLRVKRSISYETILFDNELKEQLKLMIRNIDFPQTRCTISKISETNIE
ncbi:hypothetical protein O3G_MSEX006923 [Manduca sexta]|uniref:Uncharacterized protein n=1 Tax=Manduca sexta TaxID=7130 RepID=A0A922CM74_MANSE|nr:hypothetical protein O3G_MSEX006923 [Manduca sexta]